jgi:hypothetical protein
MSPVEIRSGGGIVAKLEEGKVMTAYLPHDPRGKHIEIWSRPDGFDLTGATPVDLPSEYRVGKRELLQLADGLVAKATREAQDRTKIEPAK